MFLNPTGTKLAAVSDPRPEELLFSEAKIAVFY